MRGAMLLDCLFSTRPLEEHNAFLATHAFDTRLEKPKHNRPNISIVRELVNDDYKKLRDIRARLEAVLTDETHVRFLKLSADVETFPLQLEQRRTLTNRLIG